MNQAFYLYQLQKVDSQIDRINQRLNLITKTLANDIRIKKAEQKVHVAESSIKDAKKILKKTEDEVLAYRIKLESSEENLYSGRIKNPKELQDLQKEVKSIKSRILEIEEKQLEEMMVVEQKESILISEKSNLEKTKADFISDQAGLLGEKSKLEKEKNQFLTERNANTNSIQEDSLNIYKKLRNQKSGLAVAIIEDKACSICGATLPPAEWQAARSPHKIVFCSSCGRILYAG